ncbi:MAG: hypothetical protein ACR2PT_02065, partial [Endozoicomonas sp.]
MNESNPKLKASTAEQADGTETPQPTVVVIKKTSRDSSADIDHKDQKSWLRLFKKTLLEKESGRWFAGMVVLPWFLTAVYFVGFASDRYVSEASFMIEKSEAGAPGFEGFGLLGMVPQSSNDQRLLETFIQSPDMLYFLDKKLAVRQHYIESADWLSALESDASHERFLQFYRDHMRVRFNDTNGMLDLEIQGFSPESSLKIAELVLERSEAFVNEISHELANEQLKFVRGEVELAEQKLKGITAELVAFQNETGMLNASEQGAALSGIMNELQGELVRNQTELQTLTSFLNETAPQVVALKQRISALQKQMALEKNRITDSNNESLNDLLARQQELQLELELATKAYSSS